jgi:FtsX-like permease family
VVAVRLQTPTGEGAATLTGDSTLGPLTASLVGGRTRVITDFARGWEAQQGANVGRDRANGTTLLYSLRGSLQATGARRRQAGAGEPVPALVSPDVAAQASGRELLLRLDSGATITVRPIARAHLFPGTTGSFAVADAGRLFRAINAETPGTAPPNEVWLGLGPGADQAQLLRTLHSPPFRLASATTRSGFERALKDDPLSQSVVWALIVASVLGLALGALALALTVAVELADESGELRELEALGLRPRALRRQLRLRAALLAAIALLFGLAGGVALTRLITELIAVTANATRPVPPLIAVQPWGQTLLLLGAVAVALIIVVAAQTRRAFRGPTAGRLHG